MSEKTKLGLEARASSHLAAWFPTKSSCRSSRKPLPTIPTATVFFSTVFPDLYPGLHPGRIDAQTAHFLSCLISLNVPEDVSVERLLHRGLTSGRSDDNEQVIRNRLKEYYDKTLPVLDFYKERDIYREVNGTAVIEEVKQGDYRNHSPGVEQTTVQHRHIRLSGLRAGITGKAWPDTSDLNTWPPDRCWTMRSKPTHPPGKRSGTL
jgi:hypothetical protein